MSKRKNSVNERLKKRELWVERTMRITGFTLSETEELLSKQRQQSFRVNSLKTAILPPTIKAETVKWQGHVVGYSCDSDAIMKLRDSDEATHGEIYIQNAASWLPVIALEPKPEDVILDVCAAPGGKSSHIQALTHNQSQLTCNDNSKPRLIKLQANMERLGAAAQYTLCDASRLSRVFQPETFDKILLDAPCSGEGLMTFDDLKLFDSWSVAHIRRLSDLQKKILRESWQLLKPGGTLVYSTCTMAPEENESVIDYFLRKHEGASLAPLNFLFDNTIPALQQWNNKSFANDLSSCSRLLPGKLTEAFFVAKLVKQ